MDDTIQVLLEQCQISALQEPVIRVKFWYTATKIWFSLQAQKNYINNQVEEDGWVNIALCDSAIAQDGFTKEAPLPVSILFVCLCVRVFLAILELIWLTKKWVVVLYKIWFVDSGKEQLIWKKILNITLNILYRI